MPEPPPLAAVLRYLADLAPDRRPGWGLPRGHGAVFLWPEHGRPEIDPGVDEGSPPRVVAWSVAIGSHLDRLAAADAVNTEEYLLRIGWPMLVGTADIDGRPERVQLPLATAPVVVEGTGSHRRLVLVDDPALPAVITERLDPLERDRLEEGIPPGSAAGVESLYAWAGDVLASAGLPEARLGEVLPANPGDVDGLGLHPVAVVYAARDVDAPTIAGILRNWAGTDLRNTALEAIYGTSRITELDEATVESPLPLNAAQVRALRTARSSPVTVVSGPPGTGKSHLVAAIAMDQVAAGSSVLIATQSDQAAGVVAGLLDRYPGPRHVRFGDLAHRIRVAQELGDGLAVPYRSSDVAALERRLRDATGERDEARRHIRDMLERQESFDRALRVRDELQMAVIDAPGVLEPDIDWRRLDRWEHRHRQARGPLAGWRSARARRRITETIGAEPGLPQRRLDAALRLGRAEAEVRRLLEAGGITLGRAWTALEEAEDRWRLEVGRVIESRRRAAENPASGSRRSVAALASALRSGRVQRRRALRDLRAGQFLDVLPLWVGTLREIDDTMPAEPGIFDVVILDEASQIDQARAAPALARARRVVVVGDPRQLRHVSFVSDAAMREAAARHHLAGPLAGALDVRRNSLFDVGAGAAPVIRLDEHFRSAPHIISFSDRRFYDGTLRLMTLHPANEAHDVIDVIEIGGTRVDGVNAAEVAAAADLVAEMIESGVTSIGVLSPFRAQADALEEMVLNRFTPEVLERAGIRVGTVHGFQGSERDVIIASLAIGEDDLGSLRFLEDPNLFNVMVTRARSRMVVLLSIAPDRLPQGLLREYLKHASVPPLPPARRDPPSEWSREIARALDGFGYRVLAGYAVAGHSIDLAVGTGAAAIGVECAVASDGPDQHIDRHGALRRAGWDLIDAYQSRWLANPDAAASFIIESMLQRREPAAPNDVPPSQRRGFS